MTATRSGVTCRLIHHALLVLALVCGASACSAVSSGGPPGGDVEGDEDEQEAGDGDAPAVSPEDEASRERCRAATENARDFLEDTCAFCHGGGTAREGGFDTVRDVNAMIDTGMIVPGKPERSALYTRLASGMMPPPEVAERPSREDVSFVHDWIDCGAPSQAREPNAPSFVDIDERLDTMLSDLKSFDDSERADIRYIDLYNLANAGYSEKDLDLYRDAVSFLLNSLSTGLRVVAPQRVDDRGLMFRVELADYGWTAETWRSIVEDYPYAVIYDKDSQLFPFDEVSSQRIREETGEAIPYLQADWFMAHAARPPLYYEVLDLPASVAALEEELRVDIDASIANAQVHRSGFRDATDSRNDRVIEHHELDAGRGALWISYDFADNLGTSDVFAHPLDFEPDGLHILFNLPNGLHAYFAGDAEGRRLDKASNAVVQDPFSRDGAQEVGLSCFSCHGDSGVMAHDDQVREAFSSSGVGGEELDQVRALYAPHVEMQALFDAAAALYSSARAFAVNGVLDQSAMHMIDDRHLDALGMLEAAAVLGIPEADLRRALEASPGRFPAALRALIVRGGVVRRDAFDAVFPDLVRALDLGEPVVRGGAGDGS
jgi:hypothetical protein